MNTQTLEEYLRDVHAKDYHGTDDNMPDSFDAWIANLDTAEIIQYAEQYATEKLAKGETINK